MEFYPSDTALADIKHVMHGGMAEIASTDFETAPERLRTAYGASWQRIHDYLFEEDTTWQLADDPGNQVMAVFDRLLAEEDENVLTYANFAFLGYWDKTNRKMFGAILFEDQLPDAYPDRLVEQRLEDILSGGDFSERSDTIAQLFLNYAATVFLTRLMMPGSGLEPEEAQQGLRVLLDRCA